MVSFVKSICVVGLGYVGLPLLCLAAEKGYDAYGYDIDNSKIDAINKGISPVDNLGFDLTKLKSKLKVSSSKSIISGKDIIVICVPTPVDEKFLPDLRPIVDSCYYISENVSKGSLIILESTVYPYTSEEIIVPIFEKKGFGIGEDLFLAHCPERIDPGNKKWTIRNIPRVLGGYDEKSLELAYDFYKSILDADVVKLSSIRVAEAVKITENTFRDVNIAFVNELAKSFDKLGIDVKEVIDAASTKPFAFMPHYPGCGVGGHCIAQDPYYLIERAKVSGFDHQFLKLAREINNSMPKYTVDLLREEVDLKNAKVGVLGVSYKKDVGDVRESPALKVISILKSYGADVFVFDPFLPLYSNVSSLNELFSKSDYVILATNHSEFVNMNLSLLRENNIKFFVDGRNCIDKDKILGMGVGYKGIGR